MAILRRFLRCQVTPPLGYEHCTQGFTARFRTLFASRCLCGRGAIWSDISAECPREVHVKGDYGNLSLLLRILFGRELRDTMTQYESDLEETSVAFPDTRVTSRR